jgi:hypothetical protein
MRKMRRRYDHKDSRAMAAMLLDAMRSVPLRSGGRRINTHKNGTTKRVRNPEQRNHVKHADLADMRATRRSSA